MEFDRIVAIDWSGAKSPGKKIQVAEYRPSENTVCLIPPRKGGNWTRDRVWKEYFCEDSIESTLIGVDFAFAYPYCDVQAYFPCHPETPRDAARLWEMVDEICSGDSRFYGGAFYLNKSATFADYLRYQTYEGCRYEGRLRKTEKECKSKGLRPSDVFRCVGPSVGVGSVAGFRVLNRIRIKNVADIWPFCGRPGSHNMTLVEIYPAIHMKRAGVYLNGDPATKQVLDALHHYGVNLAQCQKNQDLTGDERDALVSAAGMKWWLDEKGSSAWETAPQSCAKYEGWIFGI